MSKLLKKIGLNSRKALNSSISSNKKNKVLKDFVKLIEINKNKIISENKKDIFYARGKKLKENLIQRLTLSNNKLKSIIDSIKTITYFKDPVNQVTSKWKRPNGLQIRRVTIPIGVIGVIFESRPNVTSDVSALCFKSGNAVILRGGSEAYNSNKILVNLFRKALKKNKVNENYLLLSYESSLNITTILMRKLRNKIRKLTP